MNLSPLAPFAARISDRRESIIESWRSRVRGDPRLATGASLPVHLLDDHLTALLEDFERRLAAEGSAGTPAATDAQMGDASAHGLHRWQQGYDLSELARELGRLNETVVVEIERLVMEPGLDEPGVAGRVREVWAEAHGIAVSESAEQFSKLQQVEAAGHIRDLEEALSALREVEAQRAALWQEAAHDLRGNLSVVAIATAGLERSPERRASGKFMAALGSNVRSLTSLLADVTSLARLQGGQEARVAARMDASAELRELVESTRGLADERGLALTSLGPDRLDIEGDAVKVRRVVQNLLLNALRYTEVGGVEVRWGDDPASEGKRWFVEVRDSGPGLPAAQGSQLAAAIGAASEQTKLVAEAESHGGVAHVTPAEAALSTAPARRGRAAGHGEGIGLSIVKRLCSLLDATIELETEEGRGSTFRVALPKAYPTPVAD